MTVKPAAQPEDDSLRGGDEQQDARRRQDTGQGVVRDERGQDQPTDKERAQRSSGLRTQKDAALQQEGQPAPGEPAGGE